MARLTVWLSLVLFACGDTTAPLQTAQPGVTFTYPVDKQVDVPLGTKLVVAFSDPVVATALTCPAFCITGPNGPATVTPTVSADGLAITVDSPGWDPGAQYTISVTSALAPFAANLPTGPLVTFTTRSDRPRAAPPTLVAVNGGDPANPESFRPMFETSTIRLVFSEPLDPRTVTLGAGSIELLDASGSAVPATVIHKGIAVSIDPVADLTPGMAYQVRLGSSILDLGGQALMPQTITLTPQDTKSGTVKQVLRSRQSGDPGTKSPRLGAATNTIVIDKPIIGKVTTTLQPFNLATELGDPKALDGPIAFTMRKGQRLKTTGFDVKLGGSIPSGLSTGDIYIELLTDGGGRMYRNPHQDPMQRPENERAPLYVDFSLDVGVYSVDAKGNATLTQTVLGLQAAGMATATDGVLDIETASAMDLGLLGVTSAPSNLVLELITDLSAQADVDTTPPSLLATFPGTATSELPVDAGIELIFSEPVDLDKLRNGGLKLENGTTAVPFVVESDGAAVVVRPTAKLAYNASYKLTLGNITDVAGNALPATGPLTFSTPAMASSNVPLAIVASYPGAPCALSNGHCAGGANGDDSYKPFTLDANDTLRVAFSQPLNGSSVTHSTQCNAGDVRVEEVDGNGACSSAVPGTLMVRDRQIEFVPDVPWTTGTHYRLTLVSGGNTSCDAGEICGLQSAASFDPLSGMTSGGAGGPNFVIDFTGAPASTGTFVFTQTAPFTDLNGSGLVDGPEVARQENAAALRVTGTHGFVSSASFNKDPDCIASTTEVENCQYLQGAMPTTMMDTQMNCMLPDGSSVPSCIPVLMSPQAMFGTSTTLHAVTSLGIGLDTPTNAVMMRLREPANGPITGYIYDKGGTPTLQVALALYMDAPDMSITLSTHDLHSKPLQLVLDGPVNFLEDGRIAIDLANTADIPVTINISNTLLGSGAVDLLVPKDLMTLQLISPPVRGALP